MKKVESEDVLCPFYRGHRYERGSVLCEGMSGGGHTAHVFEDGEHLTRQMLGRCAGDYRACPWAKTLYGMYAE